MDREPPADFVREDRYARDNAVGLLGLYGPGRYLAIKDQKVIDSDLDELDLARRMLGKHRNEFVLIRRTDNLRGLPPLRNESPERAR